MRREDMDSLIEAHLRAEMAGDSAAAVAVYTDDVEHDLVGNPEGSLHGPEAARDFYDELIAEFQNEQMEPTHRYYGEDFCVIEHRTTGSVRGSMLGIPGHGRRISFRMLHVWEFRDGRISRENVWLDGGGVVAQLAASAEAESGVSRLDERPSGAPDHESARGQTTSHCVPSSARADREPQLPPIADAYGKLPAKNVERARAFYAENLGLTPYGENAGHLYYEIGGTTFIIFPSTGAPSGTHDQLGLVVNGLESAVAGLRARGVTFEDYAPPPGATMRNGIMDRGHIKAAWFKDTEGNLISMAEFRQGSPFRRR